MFDKRHQEAVGRTLSSAKDSYTMLQDMIIGNTIGDSRYNRDVDSNTIDDYRYNRVLEDEKSLKNFFSRLNNDLGGIHSITIVREEIMDDYSPVSSSSIVVRASTGNDNADRSLRFSTLGFYSVKTKEGVPSWYVMCTTNPSKTPTTITRMVSSKNFTKKVIPKKTTLSHHTIITPETVKSYNTIISKILCIEKEGKKSDKKKI